MDVREAAKKLEISTSLVYRLCQTGKLRHLRIGTGSRDLIRISDEHLEEFRRSCERAVEVTPPADRVRRQTPAVVVPDILGAIRRKRQSAGRA
jgi:excisionase family DNA binding protein